MTFCHVFINIYGVLEIPKTKENTPCKKSKVFLSLYNDLRSKSLLSLVSLGKEVYLFMEINKSIVIERRFYFYRRNSTFRLIPLYSRIFQRAFCTITHCPSPYNMIDMRYPTRYYLQASSLALSFIFKNSIGYLDKRLSSHILTSYNLSCFVNHEFLGS